MKQLRSAALFNRSLVEFPRLEKNCGLQTAGSSSMKPSHDPSAVSKSFVKRNHRLTSKLLTSTVSAKPVLVLSDQGGKLLFRQYRHPQRTGLVQFGARISSRHQIGRLFTHA